MLETYFDQLGRPPMVVLQTFPNDVDADYTAVMTGELAGADDKWQHYQDRLRAFAERQHVQFVDLLEALGDGDAFSGRGIRI